MLYWVKVKYLKIAMNRRYLHSSVYSYIQALDGKSNRFFFRKYMPAIFTHTWFFVLKKNEILKGIEFFLDLKKDEKIENLKDLKDVARLVREGIGKFLKETNVRKKKMMYLQMMNSVTMVQQKISEAENNAVEERQKITQKNTSNEEKINGYLISIGFDITKLKKYRMIDIAGFQRAKYNS